MKECWYAIPCRNEVGSYHQEGDWTDFPRGTFLVYSRCCLVAGLNSEREAVEWNKTHTCDRNKKAQPLSEEK